MGEVLPLDRPGRAGLRAGGASARTRPHAREAQAGPSRAHAQGSSVEAGRPRCIRAGALPPPPPPPPPPDPECPSADGMPRKWSAPSAREARQIPPAPHPPTRPAAAHWPRDTEGRRTALRGGGALAPAAPGGLGSRPAGAAAADDTQRCMLSWAGRRFRPPYPERRCPPGPGRCSRSRRCRCRCGTGGARAA